ncbi:metallophosphoesterase family protein [Alkalihalobacillus hemicellulosilyticus]|uniref:Serine/threonine protein phosphatase n=1 Tax=Halalkalibacter hemicellulosilyticusJCM 9152 TaxID=1236971 RepID=W4QHU6_9BACI|nr:metallophosphoesterase family protein [Halalkalibacter hemicellulosilyticus]GAE31228.1 serine/threonine protein phosphatase [Halalkalibacter hemicellulosilyticusJCM 9152]
MKRLAIVSDIHGNIPALEAVLEDIGIRSIDEIICLGDLVGKGPESKKSVDLIKQHCDYVVMGNWDDFITKPTDYEVIKWHQEQLTDEDFQYLRSLPHSYEFWLSGQLIRLFHASPRSVYERIQPWDAIDDRMSLFRNSELTANIAGETEPNIIIYGDIHNAYIEHHKRQTIMNVGSVGNPLDQVQASYVIVEGIPDQLEEGVFSIQFMRVPYDVELAIQRAKEMSMPELEEYTLELRTGQYRGAK